MLPLHFPCTSFTRTVRAPQSQHEKRDLALLMSGAVGPVKPVPTGLRDAGLTTPLAVVKTGTTAHP
jgi:hypothetical protein